MFKDMLACMVWGTEVGYSVICFEALLTSCEVSSAPGGCRAQKFSQREVCLVSEAHTDYRQPAPQVMPSLDVPDRTSPVASSTSPITLHIHHLPLLLKD